MLFIAQTVARGNDAALIQRGILAPLSAPDHEQRPSHAASQLASDSSHASHSPSPSRHSEQSLMDEEDVFDYNLSGGEEEAALDRPQSMGLFRPELFKTLLHTAKATANMGVSMTHAQNASEPRNSNKLLFTEGVTEQEGIPSPKLFIDTVQRQWAQPGSISTPSSLDRKLYTVDQELEDLHKLPAVDDPMPV